MLTVFLCAFWGSTHIKERNNTMPTPLQLQHDALWKQRYRLPVTYGLQIAAHAPTRGLALSTRSGVEQLYAWDIPSGKLVQITHSPEGTGNTADGIPGAVLSPNGRFVYYLDDTKGDETGHYVRIPFDGGTPEDITPDLPLYVGFMFNFNVSGNLCGFTMIIDGVYHICTLAIQSDGCIGERKILYQSATQTRGPILSSDGKVAVIETKRSGEADFGLLAIEVATGRHIGHLLEEEGGLELYLASPLADDTRFLALSSRNGSWRPLLWNPLTGEQFDLELPEIEGDIVPMDWSGQSVLLRQDQQNVQRLYVYDLTHHSVRGLEKLGGGTFGNTEPKSIFFAPDGDIYALWENSAQPRQLIALSSETGERKRVVLASEDTLPGHSWSSVTFLSSDRQPVQGWLALPSHTEGPFPCILEVRGGPEFAVMDTFSPSSQSWADHGFAYLTVNYRGSTGFGKEFQEKIRGDLGHWEVEDMVAARNWLVQQGIAEPSQIFVTGWSWGGYLTLQALGTRPSLWAGGMAGVAMGDLTINDETSAIRTAIRGLMGGTPQEKPELYKAASPITYAAQVVAPLLIIQGRNDTRSVPRSIEVYEARMKELGKHIEVHWFDVGHGIVDVEQRIEHQELMLRFVYRVLEKGV
jgi:dienelactone hydrolase